MPPQLSFLLALPDEILTHILSYLDPYDLNAIQLSNKRLHSLAQEPLLWRHLCRVYYRFWSPKHRLAARLRQPVTEVPWRKIFLDRKKLDYEVDRRMDMIIATQQNRANHIEWIAEQGYDVKSALLRHKNTGEESEDVLARRFWSSAILTTIHRSIAMEEWCKLRKGESRSLERALGAYDMFVLDSDEGAGDLDMIGQQLDELAAQFKAEHPDWADYSTRRRAILLVDFLRSAGFQGVPSERYGQIAQNFIGLVLSDKNHEALPLITNVIFCSVAERLGIEASPCGYPYHIYTIVQAPPELTLDGARAPGLEAPDTMYMDPFRSSQEVSRLDLEGQLRTMGASAASFATYLEAANPIEMVIRTARNIRRAVESGNGLADPAASTIGIQFTHTHLNLHSALHAALWAWLYLERGDPIRGGEEAGGIALHRRRILISKVVQQCLEFYPWEIWLVERYMASLFHDLPEEGDFLYIIQREHTADRNKKALKRRGDHTKNVRYGVGQCFKHKRYHYYGVIVGWDPYCNAGDDWMHAMNIDGLPNGRNQAFYNVLCEDSSSRYVAEENIQITTDPPPDFLLNKLAGRYFRRWDVQEARFVSNIRDEYPDD
ncbi:F-box domain cyclin-like protein [Macrophomina phaseolina MS6]|uniref:F-box domain cyclin-like protein n=2 Tax=Macrophomina phaseolina TaxID=35725 RepID=K2S204_MACPH|nr:F-box domain cyclin-like protein [Macrophomina phaseolina MS6]